MSIFKLAWLSGLGTFAVLVMATVFAVGHFADEPVSSIATHDDARFQPIFSCSSNRTLNGRLDCLKQEAARH